MQWMLQRYLDNPRTVISHIGRFTSFSSWLSAHSSFWICLWVLSLMYLPKRKKNLRWIIFSLRLKRASVNAWYSAIIKSQTSNSLSQAIRSLTRATKLQYIGHLTSSCSYVYFSIRLRYAWHGTRNHPLSSLFFKKWTSRSISYTLLNLSSSISEWAMSTSLILGTISIVLLLLLRGLVWLRHTLAWR